MAMNRESAGLQIALIIFVIITVGLGVSTYSYWSAAEKYKAESEAARKAAADSDTALRNVRQEAIELKEMIGGDGTVPIATMKTNFEQDMLNFGQGHAEESRNYRALPEHLMTAIRRLNEQVSDGAAREKSQVAAQAAIRQEEQARVAEAQKAQQAANADLAEERTKFKADHDRLVAESRTYSNDLDKQRTSNTELEANQQREATAFRGQVDQLQRRVDDLTKQIREGDAPQMEHPDGRITWVNQRSQVVWINLGSADGLPRQIVFGVYEVDSNNVATGEVKGSIEVTRILGDHQAEARIVSDSPNNPILANDVIYSPIWRPGQRLRFALAGFMDINGDGRSDRDVVRNLITMNGGIIDAEVADDGKRTGTVSVHTRYLVLGERPTEATNPEVLRNYSNIVDSSEKLRIEQISVHRLLAILGYKPEMLTQPLGPGSGGTSDFRPRVPRNPGRER